MKLLQLFDGQYEFFENKYYRIQIYDKLLVLKYTKRCFSISGSKLQYEGMIAIFEPRIKIKLLIQ